MSLLDTMTLRTTLMTLVLLGCSAGPKDQCHEACEVFAQHCDDHKKHCILPTETGKFDLQEACSHTAEEACVASCKQSVPDNAVVCSIHFTTCDDDEGYTTGIRGECFEP